jgi:hypothetical protein
MGRQMMPAVPGEVGIGSHANREHARVGEARKAGKLAKGTRGAGRPKIGGPKREPPKGTPTLLEIGVDRKRASRAKRLKAYPERRNGAKRHRDRGFLAIGERQSGALLDPT